MRSRIQQFLEICTWVHAKGWTPATAGNFSLRISDNDFLISGSGLDKGSLREADLLRVRDGKPEDHPSLKPSAETDLHTAVYDFDPSIRCVLHNHSVASAALSYWYPKDTLTISGLEMLKVLRGYSTHQAEFHIPLIDNDQDMQVIVKKLKVLWQEQKVTHAFILRGHGLYTWGTSEQEAKRHLEGIEFLLAVRLELEKLNKR